MSKKKKSINPEVVQRAVDLAGLFISNNTGQLAENHHKLISAIQAEILEKTSGIDDDKAFELAVTRAQEIDPVGSDAVDRQGEFFAAALRAESNNLRERGK